MLGTVGTQLNMTKLSGLKDSVASLGEIKSSNRVGHAKSLWEFTGREQSSSPGKPGKALPSRITRAGPRRIVQLSCDDENGSWSRAGGKRERHEQRIALEKLQKIKGTNLYCV